jgi:hypothetical protein
MPCGYWHRGRLAFAIPLRSSRELGIQRLAPNAALCGLRLYVMVGNEQVIKVTKGIGRGYTEVIPVTVCQSW